MKSLTFDNCVFDLSNPDNEQLQQLIQMQKQMILTRSTSDCDENMQDSISKLQNETKFGNNVKFTDKLNFNKDTQIIYKLQLLNTVFDIPNLILNQLIVNEQYFILNQSQLLDFLIQIKTNVFDNKFAEYQITNNLCDSKFSQTGEQTSYTEEIVPSKNKVVSFQNPLQFSGTEIDQITATYPLISQAHNYIKTLAEQEENNQKILNKFQNINYQGSVVCSDYESLQNTNTSKSSQYYTDWQNGGMTNSMKPEVELPQLLYSANNLQPLQTQNQMNYETVAGDQGQLLNEINAQNDINMQIRNQIYNRRQKLSEQQNLQENQVSDLNNTNQFIKNENIITNIQQITTEQQQTANIYSDIPKQVLQSQHDEQVTQHTQQTDQQLEKTNYKPTTKNFNEPTNQYIQQINDYNSINNITQNQNTVYQQPLISDTHVTSNHSQNQQIDDIINTQAQNQNSMNNINQSTIEQLQTAKLHIGDAQILVNEINNHELELNQLVNKSKLQTQIIQQKIQDAYQQKEVLNQEEVHHYNSIQQDQQYQQLYEPKIIQNMDQIMNKPINQQFKKVQQELEQLNIKQANQEDSKLKTQQQDDLCQQNVIEQVILKPVHHIQKIQNIQYSQQQMDQIMNKYNKENQILMSPTQKHHINNIVQIKQIKQQQQKQEDQIKKRKRENELNDIIDVHRQLKKVRMDVSKKKRFVLDLEQFIQEIQ